MDYSKKDYKVTVVNMRTHEIVDTTTGSISNARQVVSSAVKNIDCNVVEIPVFGTVHNVSVNVNGKSKYFFFGATFNYQGTQYFCGYSVR